MRFKKYLEEDITIPIKIGDVVLGGKFKNKKVVVKEIGKNEKGDITINGKPLLKFRIIPQVQETNLGVIFGQGPEVRAYPKTGMSRDFLLSRERGLTPKDDGGFANTVDNYYDPLDPRNKSKKKKKSWYKSNERITG